MEPVKAEEEDEDVPGAPQVYDEEALRARIAKLPVVFGASTRQLATDDGLRDLQNVGEMEGYRFPGLDLLENPEENFSVKLEEYVREQPAAAGARGSTRSTARWWGSSRAR